MQKKLVTVAGITLSLVTLVPSLAIVVSPLAVIGAQQVIPTGNITTIDQVVALTVNAMNWIFTIFLVVAVIFLIVGAFQYLTAGGDPEKQGLARSRIIYSLIGVGVAVLAFTLIRFVGNYLTGTTLTVPT